MKLEHRENFIRRVLGERLAGHLAYRIRRNQCLSPWEGVFNKQLRRKELCDRIFEVFDPKVIVETGTYHGSTTEYFAASGRHVFGVECSPFHAAYAASRLRRYQRANVTCSDSRTALRQLVRHDLLRSAGVFIYLDAHWGTDLPLLGEIQILFKQARFTPVVMVDDFEVPFDAGYQFDDYGRFIGSLTIDWIQPHLQSLSVSAFFPTIPSSSETGAKRGSVVLVRSEDEHLIGDLSGYLTKWDAGRSAAA